MFLEVEGMSGQTPIGRTPHHVSDRFVLRMDRLSWRFSSCATKPSTDAQYTLYASVLKKVPDLKDFQVLARASSFSHGLLHEVSPLPGPSSMPEYVACVVMLTPYHPGWSQYSWTRTGASSKSQSGRTKVLGMLRWRQEVAPKVWNGSMS